jgi:hypothetical protein
MCLKPFNKLAGRVIRHSCSFIKQYSSLENIVWIFTSELCPIYLGNKLVNCLVNIPSNSTCACSDKLACFGQLAEYFDRANSLDGIYWICSTCVNKIWNLACNLQVWPSVSLPALGMLDNCRTAVYYYAWCM